MYIATIPNRNSPPAILLRESYRENNKVRTRTVANITTWSPERIDALRHTLKGELDLVAAQSSPQCAEVFGTLFVLKQLADEVGITSALGNTKLSKHALFLVSARIAHQGSRLSAVRFAKQHAVTALSRFIFLWYEVDEKSVLRLPQPDDLQRTILKALGISLPRQETKM